ncbi:MAG: ABC transporter substrate-binding protein [Ottowia sp.]|uniref:ABC transporter substrate-binding protein n=1 Tax=Ottowia sp. TaxID=1898956 RepID=UPI0039E49420
MSTFETPSLHPSLPSLPRRQALAWMGGLAMGATAPAWAQGAAGAGKVLRIAAPTNPSSLDPATGGAGTDHSFLWTLYDTLVDWDYDTLRTRPGMAEFRFSDPKTLVLDIKPGISFHDGTPCDAEAVKFNLDRNRQDARSNVKADLVAVESVGVTGPLQVTVKLKAADVTIPAVLSDRAGMMISPKAVKELGNDSDRKPVGTGPWKFVSWADNQKLVVARHEKYWRAGLPHMDGIEFSIITDQATALRTVTAGQNDFAYALSARYKPLIERAKNLTLITAPTLFVYQLYLNWSRGPLSNQKIRQAMNFAIDRQAFINAGMGGLGEVAGMQLPSSHWAHDKGVASMYGYDPERARKLVAEAGLGSSVEITVCGWNDQDSLRRNEIVMEQLGKVGIRCKFTVGTVPEVSGQFFGNEKKFDAALSAWTGRPDPSMTYALMYAKDAYYNAGRADTTPQINALLAESRQKTALEERRQIFAKLQRLVMEQAYSVPLAFQFEVDAAGPKIKGYKPDLLGKPKFIDIAPA